MHFKSLLLLAALIGAVAADVAQKQNRQHFIRFVNGVRAAKQGIQQRDEIVETATESPLKVQNEIQNGLNSSENAADAAKAQRPNSKQPKFPLLKGQQNETIDVSENSKIGKQGANKKQIKQQQQKLKEQQQQKRQQLQQQKLKQQQNKRRQQQKRKNAAKNKQKPQRRPQQQQRRPQQQQKVGKKPARKTNGNNKNGKKGQQQG